MVYFRCQAIFEKRPRKGRLGWERVGVLAVLGFIVYANGGLFRGGGSS